LADWFSLEHATVEHDQGNTIYTLTFSNPLSTGSSINDENQTVSASPEFSPIDVLIGGGTEQLFSADTVQTTTSPDFTFGNSSLTFGTPDAAEIVGIRNNQLRIVDSTSHSLGFVGNPIRILQTDVVRDIFGQQLILTAPPVATDDANFAVLEAPPCIGDCDDSGDVDFNDLVSMLFNFGTGALDARCDADQSGTVDFNDLVSALFRFGPCE